MTDLHLQRLAVAPADRGVNRPVAILLRHCDVVVELTGNVLPFGVDDQGIGPLQDIVGSLPVGDAVAQVATPCAQLPMKGQPETWFMTQAMAQHFFFPQKQGNIVNIIVDVFRGVPVILVVYLVGFGVPGLGLPRPWNSPYIWGSLALILVYAAYVAEVIRSGIDSIHDSQRSAAASLGLSEADTMRYVILPQAVRRVVPANMNLFIALQKDVALLSFIGPVEIFRQAGVYKSLFANFTPYIGAALIFLAITIPATRYADYLMHRQRRARG
mgnify:CR=1 FL=1